MERMIEGALAKQELGVWGQGRGARDYLYIKDVTSAIRAALAKPQLGGIFNVSSGVPVSYIELAETINRVFDNTGNLRLLGDRRADERVQYLACDRAARKLGWQPRWSLEAALHDLQETITPPGSTFSGR
jgi:nucleoside-diphosphate-sugar epimerase